MPLKIKNHKGSSSFPIYQTFFTPLLKHLITMNKKSTQSLKLMIAPCLYNVLKNIRCTSTN